MPTQLSSCYIGLIIITNIVLSPLPSNRHRLSCGDCLEDKSEDYQNCSVLYDYNDANDNVLLQTGRL